MTKTGTNDLNNQLPSNVTLRILVGISLIVIIIQVATGYIIYLKLANWNERASFGEMFGAVNTLFSGLAFAGVIYAIFLQRRELELQRNELTMTREELRRSAEAQEKSEKALSEQARMLVQTAKLNALNSVVEAYSKKLALMRRDGVHQSNQSYKQEKSKYDEHFGKLEELISNMGSL